MTLCGTVQQQNRRNELVSRFVCVVASVVQFCGLSVRVCRLLPGTTCAAAFLAQTSFVYMTRVSPSLGCCITGESTCCGFVPTLL